MQNNVSSLRSTQLVSVQLDIFRTNSKLSQCLKANLWELLWQWLWYVPQFTRTKRIIIRLRPTNL